MLLVTAAIIVRDNKVLITQRSQADKLSLKWEFPGGKLEEDETPEACLKREIMEELNVDIKVLSYVNSCVYDDGNREIKLMAYNAQILSGDLRLNVHNDAKWVTMDELRGYDLAPADVALIDTCTIIL